MKLPRVVLIFSIFLMTALFQVDHSTPNNILAVYEKSFYLEMENGFFDEKPDDEGVSGSVPNAISFINTLISLISEEPFSKLNFHLVTVFYQGNYI